MGTSRLGGIMWRLHTCDIQQHFSLDFIHGFGQPTDFHASRRGPVAVATIIPLPTLKMIGRKWAEDCYTIEARNWQTTLEDGVEPGSVGIRKPDLLVASRPSITYVPPYWFASLEKQAPLKPPLPYAQTRHQFNIENSLCAYSQNFNP